MRILPLLFLVVLAVLALGGFAALAGGYWLGLLAGPGIRMQFAPPALLVAADQPITEEALRADRKSVV